MLDSAEGESLHSKYMREEKYYPLQQLVSDPCHISCPQPRYPRRNLRLRSLLGIDGGLFTHSSENNDI